MEPRSKAFVADYFTPDEQARFEDAAEAERAWLANLTWSPKASTLKALREGLRLDTRCVVVQLTSPGKKVAWQPLSVVFPERHQTFQGWFRGMDGFVQTLVAYPAPRRPVALMPLSF